MEFGVLQIVDIALRAISPAVNDPSTAINCIDHLSRLLIRFASRQLPNSILYDLPGEPRVIISWIDFEGLLKSAFEQIHQYGRADVAVCLRMLRALGDIAITTDLPAYRQLIVELGTRIVAGYRETETTRSTAEMRSRLSSLETMLSDPGFPGKSFVP